MSDQLTQCPHCQTSFRVAPGQLRSAGGLVRCGACLGLFSAAINFIRVKPDPDDDSSDDVPDFTDAGNSDDILLGDLDIDDLLAEHESDDDAAALEADPADDAEYILLSDPVRIREVQSDDYELYEEYEDAPDLLANLATAPVAQETAPTDSEPFVLTPDTVPEPSDTHAQHASADADLDWLDGPSEEFQPRTILFDEDEEDDDADELADSDDTNFDDGYAEETAASSRDASLERGGPVLGDLEAEEFDTPELSELELDKLLLSHDAGDNESEELEDPEEAREALDNEEYGEEFEDADDENSFIAASEPSFGDDEADAEAILEEYMEEMRADSRDAGHLDDLDTIAPPASQHAVTGKGKPDWLQRRDPPPAEKAALHDYLATLEDEDELGPLGADHLDELDDEPVMLVQERGGHGLLAATAMLLLGVLLTGTLLLQFVDQHLEALRQRNSFARFEPWFCAILACPPPPAPVTAGSSLYSQELLIRSHPRLQGALELSFIFRNDADTPQPFPGLELSFKDPANTLLANRLLLPADYLPPELRSLATMPARSSVQVMLELVDPGAEAVNYTIAFRDL